MPAGAPPDGNEQLRNYAAHGPIFDQAMAFLAQIIATVTIYTSVTGACWVVVSGNVLGVSNTMLQCILGLHIALSSGVAASLWGMGNNFIQRLNLAQWLGIVFWRDITVLGSTAVSWCGIPNDRVSQSGVTLEDITRDPGSLIKSFDEWKGSKSQKSSTHISRKALYLGFYLRYRAPNWPNLRFQRLWFIMPLLAGVVSTVFLLQTHSGGATRKAICRQASQTLSFRNSASMSRETFERSRYLFDKAGCELHLIVEQH